MQTVVGRAPGGKAHAAGGSPHAWRTNFLAIAVAVGLLTLPGAASAFHFSTGNPDGKMASGSRPESPGKIEIESADDFVLTDVTHIDHATFTGLVPAGGIATITAVAVEFYHVFPKDSDTTRTPNVPTRTNSPADVAFADADSAGGTLVFSASSLTTSFTASNSVLNGINPSPNQTTNGEGPVTGDEILFDVTFTPPIVLPADNYFFIPQVELTSGDFLWLSAPKPIVAPGTPFAPDRQSWIRNANLDPDWLRIGMDIVGGTTPPAFNATFSLDGQTEADLAISKTAPPSVATGGTLTFTLEVSNAGPTTATNVVVTDVLPAGTKFLGFGGSGWSCLQGPPGTVQCTLATLAPQTAAPPLTIEVAAPQMAGALTNTASVSADQVDLVPGNNTASAQTRVVAEAPTLGQTSLALLALLLVGSGLTRLRRPMRTTR